MTPGEGEDKTIKGILTKLGLIMGFILLVPGIMGNVLGIDPLDGCVRITEGEVKSLDAANVAATKKDKDAELISGHTEGTCWRAVTAGDDKLTKAKVAFDRDIIGLVSWALTAFILIMVVVGFVFPGRDIITYIRKEQ